MFCASCLGMPSCRPTSTKWKKYMRLVTIDGFDDKKHVKFVPSGRWHRVDTAVPCMCVQV